MKTDDHVGGWETDSNRLSDIVSDMPSSLVTVNL
jgi:hypothetical protein